VLASAPNLVSARTRRASSIHMIVLDRCISSDIGRICPYVKQKNATFLAPHEFEPMR